MKVNPPPDADVQDRAHGPSAMPVEDRESIQIF